MRHAREFGGRRELGWAILLCSLAAALFLGPALSSGRIFSPADRLFSYPPWQGQALAGWPGPGNALVGDDSAFVFEPWAAYAARQLHAGALPLWNPDNLLGVPFVGNMQSAIFSPLAWPYWLWPDPHLLVVQAWLKLVLAALGMYVLARDTVGLRLLGAAVAAIAFAFGAFLTVWLLYPLTAAVIWLPWLWWATARLIAQPGRRAVATLGGIVALSVLAGHPETAYHLGLLTGLFALFCAGQGGAGRPVAWLRGLGLWAASYLLGVAVAAIQLLPFLDYLAQSTMWHTRTGETALPALAFRYAWALISPNLFGNPAHRDWWAPTTYNEISTYIGMVPLLLAPLALLGRARGSRRLVLFLLALGALAAGVVYRVPGIFEAVTALPGMRLVANQRLLFLIQFVLALLAGLGLEALVAALPAGRRRPAIVLGLAGTLVVAGGIGLPWLLGAPWFGVPAPPDPALAVWQAGLLRALLLLLVAGGLLGAVLALGAARPRAARAALTVLPLLLFADLLQAHGDYNPTVATQDYYPATPATTFLQQQAAAGPFRVVATRRTFPPNANLMYGLADVRNYDALEPQLYHDLAIGIEPAVRLKPGGSPTIFRAIVSPLIDLFNVRYVLAAPGEDPNGPSTAMAPARFVRVLDGGAGGSSVFENRQALPRAWLVHRVEVQPDVAAQVARLADPAFDRAGTALVDALLPPTAGLPPPLAPAGGDVVTITRYLPADVAVATRSRAAGLLVLADQAFSGWEAQVDGQPAPILTADHALRAVYLPAGVHTVSFAYRPGAFLGGALLTGGGLLVLVGLVAWPGRRTMDDGRWTMDDG